MNKQSDITEDIITWTVIILLVSRTGRFLGLLYQTEMELYVPLSSLLKQNTIEWLREGKEIESLQMLVETVPRSNNYTHPSSAVGSNPLSQITVKLGVIQS